MHSSACTSPPFKGDLHMTHSRPSSSTTGSAAAAGDAAAGNASACSTNPDAAAASRACRRNKAASRFRATSSSKFTSSLDCDWPSLGVGATAPSSSALAAGVGVIGAISSDRVVGAANGCGGAVRGPTGATASDAVDITGGAVGARGGNTIDGAEKSFAVGVAFSSAATVGRFGVGGSPFASAGGVG